MRGGKSLQAHFQESDEWLQWMNKSNDENERLELLDPGEVQKQCYREFSVLQRQRWWRLSHNKYKTEC